jgi:DNA-binding CsgD family transcriptional regulator
LNSDSLGCRSLTSAFGEIYAAAEDSALWPAVLDRIAQVVEADGCWLAATYVDSAVKDVRVFTGADPAMLQDFNEHYYSVNVWAERMDRIFPVGAVGYSHLAIPNGELYKTEFYSDFLKPNRMGYCMGVIAQLPDQPPALLIGVRAPERGPFDECQGRIFETFLPHIQRALRLHRELATLRLSNQSLEAALDAFDRAVVGLNGEAKILFCNQSAARLLAEADGLRVKDGRLLADSPAKDSELQTQLKRCAVNGAGFSEQGGLLIERNTGRPALRLALMPFANNLLGHVPTLTTLVFVDDPVRKPLSRSLILRTLFRLSPTEARITDLLIAGYELPTIADLLKMSCETSRYHLKSIFRKTGARRQADLIQMTLNLPAEAALTPDRG